LLVEQAGSHPVATGQPPATEAAWLNLVSITPWPWPNRGRCKKF